MLLFVIPDCFGFLISSSYFYIMLCDNTYYYFTSILYILECHIIVIHACELLMIRGLDILRLWVVPMLHASDIMGLNLCIIYIMYVIYYTKTWIGSQYNIKVEYWSNLDLTKHVPYLSLMGKVSSTFEFTVFHSESYRKWPWCIAGWRGWWWYTSQHKCVGVLHCSLLPCQFDTHDVLCTTTNHPVVGGGIHHSTGVFGCCLAACCHANLTCILWCVRSPEWLVVVHTSAWVCWAVSWQFAAVPAWHSCAVVYATTDHSKNRNTGWLAKYACLWSWPN